MKRSILVVILIVAVSLVCGGFGVVHAQKAFKLDLAWQPEHETFAAWYAKEKGWDKEEGLDFQLHYFDSGMAQMEALPARQWVIAGMGGVPATVGLLRYGTVLIAVGNDESETNCVLVRKDSPILKTKGFNPKYPEVFGSPETIKGKTILCTTVSSGHFAMSKWLEVFGLRDKDVVIKNMDQAQAVAAFEAGIGDAVALWAPHIYTGLGKGWQIVGNTKTCGAAQPIVLIAEKEFSEKNPEIVAKFLRVYFRSINAIKKDSEKLVPEYHRFYKDWAGLDLSLESAKMDLLMHPVFTLEEQIKMFDVSGGPSEVQKWLQAILDFFTTQGRFRPEEREKAMEMMKAGYITDKFLKMVKTPIP